MLVFEKSKAGRRNFTLPPTTVPGYSLNAPKREAKTNLPELSEVDVVRHYTNLTKNIYGVDNGFYPLGSCTMKYNPKLNEDVAGMKQFSQIHPLQPEYTVQGCIEVYELAEKYLCEITGMDRMTFQPAAGAHGELTGLLLIKQYHKSRNDEKRKVVLVPDSAHGTNPASAAMAGFQVVTIPSKNGNVDLEQLRQAVNETTAALMLTNPNTLGLFEKDITEISKTVHDAGGLVYYDGANLNAIMGVTRPGDMGFDVIHLNLHKTFSTPHGGGGPGSGAVGVKNCLLPYLPAPVFEHKSILTDRPESIGRMKQFYGNFLVVVRALTYILRLGAEGIVETSQHAVLNANYLLHMMKDQYQVSVDEPCMHEFVLTLETIKKETGVSALDIAKGLIDNGIHPPTMYFPMIVHEALMFEPTETESKETLEHAAAVMAQLKAEAYSNPEARKAAPVTMPIGRADEVKAARQPILTYNFKENA